MEMTFDQFEQAPERTLSVAQERRLNHKHATGDFGGGSFATVQSLVRKGFVAEVGGSYVLTERAAHYLFHYGQDMPI